MCKHSDPAKYRCSVHAFAHAIFTYLIMSRLGLIERQVHPSGDIVSVL